MKELRQTAREFPERVQESDNLDVLELTDMVEEEEPQSPGEEADAEDTSATQEEESIQELSSEESDEPSDVLLLTDLIEDDEPAEEQEDLSTQEHRVMKERLQQVLQRVRAQREGAPGTPEQSILAQVMQDMGQEEPLDSTDFSEAQEEKVKERLKHILEAAQAKQQQVGREIDTQSLRQTLLQMYPTNAELKEALKPGENRLSLDVKEGADVVPVQEFHPLSKDEEFVSVCEKVSKGQSLELLKTLSLSEREQDLVNAFTAHLSSYKGLKKQQVFEMQHLTSRSIHELDLIFKTYRIQGYLKAELNNVYNRLLNLRGRYSILQN